MKYLRQLFNATAHTGLGPHATEAQMPSTLHDSLAKEDQSNKIRGLIPKLAQLLEADPNVTRAYLCTNIAVQVTKVPGEAGGFCGYRNIQMMMLSLPLDEPAVKQSANEHAFDNIFNVQDLIEQAWDDGHHAQGREQTGGIRGTRKYIGSLEVEAVLLHLGLKHVGRAFRGEKAHEEVVHALWDYFGRKPAATGSTSESDTPNEGALASKATSDMPRKLTVTQNAPVYLQRPGHSFTVIGVEERLSGVKRLLVFDPAWMPPAAMCKPGALSESALRSHWRGEWMLSMYRKPRRYMRRFDEFEVVMLV
jgi:zinc finger-containing ubiquitin peptidase 1